MPQPLSLSTANALRISLAILGAVAVAHIAGCGTCPPSAETKVASSLAESTAAGSAQLPATITATIDLPHSQRRATLRIPGPEFEAKLSYNGVHVSSKGTPLSVFVNGNQDVVQLRKEIEKGHYRVIDKQAQWMVLAGKEAGPGATGEEFYFGIVEFISWNEPGGMANQLKCETGFLDTEREVRKALAVCLTLKHIP